MKSPEPSPVKGRPVRLAPWAPGASPRIRRRARGIAEAGDGAGPVGLVLVGAAAGFADAAAVVAQPGAALAGDDGVVNLLKDLIRNLYAGRLSLHLNDNGCRTESRGSLAESATWVE